MDYEFISGTELFSGLSAEETREILNISCAYTKLFGKEETVFELGSETSCAAMVLCGSVRVERPDFYGTVSIISTIGPGEMFAEAYAFAHGEKMMVSAVAAEESEILFIDTEALLESGNITILKNFLKDASMKNLRLSRKIVHTSPKTIRGRVLEYFAYLSQNAGGNEFIVPFSRSRMAEYLSVDRSALSAELSKMRREGIIEFEKNRFRLMVSRRVLT